MQSTDVKIAVTLYLYVDTVISWRGIFSCLACLSFWLSPFCSNECGLVGLVLGHTRYQHKIFIIFTWCGAVERFKESFKDYSTKRKTTLWCCLRNYSTQHKSVGTVVSISETGLLECRAVNINSYLPHLNIKRLRRLGLVWDWEGLQ